MTTTVQERQQLAAQLRQVATDNAFVYQAGLLDKRLRALPDVPSFDESQVALGSTAEVLRSSHDCTDLVTLGGEKLPYNQWLDLLDGYFHDDRLPMDPLPQVEDALDLACDLVKRDAVAKAVERNRRTTSKLTREIPALEEANELAISQHRAQVAQELAEPKRQLEGARQQRSQLAGILGTKARNEDRINTFVKGWLPFIIGIAVFYLTHRLLFGLGAYFVSVFCIPLLLIVLNDSGRKDQERQSDELGDYIGRMEAYISSCEADPAWYANELDRIASKRMSLGIASSTVDALGSYEWPLSAEEAGTLKRLSADISSDARSWRELTLGIIERSCDTARERISQTCNEIGLMPNAIPNALELAAVVENGYADDVKEAMLYMATDRYRTSNLGLQAAQLNQLELTRMENAQYMRDLMAQLFVMSSQLESIDAGIGDVVSRLDTTNRTLDGMSRTLDSIDSGVWATASAAQATAANTAATAANTSRIAENTSHIARNTAVGAYHAARTADAATALRDFYAEDHPSHNANGDNQRRRRLGTGESYTRGYM
ncbi:MAG: hypothetical protein IJM67_02850 [Atopobiaceae bacterium]|nr:hypothetical protein [Atopobiaceae bacterium]